MTLLGHDTHAIIIEFYRLLSQRQSFHQINGILDERQHESLMISSFAVVLND